MLSTSQGNFMSVWTKIVNKKYLVQAQCNTLKQSSKINTAMDFLYTISYWLIVLAHVGIALGGVFGVSQ